MSFPAKMLPRASFFILILEWRLLSHLGTFVENAWHASGTMIIILFNLWAFPDNQFPGKPLPFSSLSLVSPTFKGLSQLPPLTSPPCSDLIAFRGSYVAYAHKDTGVWTCESTANHSSPLVDGWCIHWTDCGWVLTTCLLPDLQCQPFWPITALLSLLF